MSKNVVELEGNIVKDIELKGSEGKNFCYLTIAVNRARGSGTDFVSVKTFKTLAESCAKSLKKGDSVAVVAHISTGSYEKDKQKRYTTDIVADTVKKLAKGERTDGVIVEEQKEQ